MSNVKEDILEATLTHVNWRGEAQMVDVTDKPQTFRQARACTVVQMKPETLRMILEGRHAKGDVLAVARVAGIQAAKKCSDLIPLCHPLALTSAKVTFTPVSEGPLGTSPAGESLEQAKLLVTTDVKVSGQTGVEMEALTAASVAALTIYDMCKAVEPGMVITDTRVLGKCGGKRDWGVCS